MKKTLKHKYSKKYSKKNKKETSKKNKKGKKQSGGSVRNTINKKEFTNLFSQL